jgi:hypothetical protein
MHSKILMMIVVVAVTANLASCAQMPRHSNALVFGTNTTIGIGIGQSATQTPEVDIGYRRQEVAIVPVLANTAEAGGKLTPCNEATIENCKFQATHNGTDKDSYSTLASFGSEMGTDATGSANVSIAQYFATGVAAQQLVISGGANVIQAGGDTEAKAKAAEKAAELKIVQERANADIFAKKLSIGEVAAKTILGDNTSTVAPAKLTLLSNSMPGAGSACSVGELGKLDQSNVEAFIKDLRAQKPTCVRRLADNVQK